VPLNKSQLGRIGLGLLILVLLVALALILLSLLQVATPSRPSPTGDNVVLFMPPDSGLTLAESARQAETSAHTWADDIMLIRAEAAWRPGEAGRQIEMPPVTWSFYYYSPSAHELMSVVVAKEQLFRVPAFPISYDPQTIPALPPFGADVAWLSFRAAGGDAFLRAHPEAMVDFHLLPNDGSVVWRVSAFQGGDFLEVLIDAQSGAVISY
jgi:hypothetical protein